MIKTKSLKGNNNFKNTLKYGKFVCGKTLTIYLKKNNIEDNQLGICVSKKHGNSVVRNKLKRWVRESYKELEVSLLHGYNIIVLYKKNIKVDELTFSLIRNEIKELFIENELYVK